MNLATLRRHRDRILAIADKYGAENVRVFGSVARGDASQVSDVDLLVRHRPGTSLMDVAGMYGDLKDLLGCEVDIVSEKTIPPYAQHIFAEAQAL